MPNLLHFLEINFWCKYLDQSKHYGSDEYLHREYIQDQAYLTMEI